MKLVMCIRYLKIILLTVATASFALETSAQTTNNSHTPFSDAENLGIEKSIEDLKTYLETLKLYNVNTVWGSTRGERLMSQDWLNRDMADNLVKHGVNKAKLLKIAGNDAGAIKLLGRHARYEANFEDYLKLAEIAVLARIGDASPNSPMTYAGPGFFNLKISDILSADSDIKNITVANSLNSHHRKLHTGQDCVFFLSPTYTKHYIAPGKDYPNLPEYLREALPDSFLTARYPTYCSKDGETFSRDTQIGGPDHITRSEILSLVKTIP